jgi:hypothetical protein
MVLAAKCLAAGVAAICSIVAWIRHTDRLLYASATDVEALFPSPAADHGHR